MTITIYGAGAIGGLTGACLARAGEDVRLVDKVAEHVDAMNRTDSGSPAPRSSRCQCGPVFRLI